MYSAKRSDDVNYSLKFSESFSNNYNRISLFLIEKCGLLDYFNRFDAKLKKCIRNRKTLPTLGPHPNNREFGHLKNVYRDIVDSYVVFYRIDTDGEIVYVKNIMCAKMIKSTDPSIYASSEKGRIRDHHRNWS